MQRKTVYRGLFYGIGLLLLALGITLNTRVGFGVSPIISVSYSISTLTHTNFGNMTLLLYIAFVLVELVLHGIMGRHTAGLKRQLLLDVLQIPLSLVFTRFMNLFAAWIPEFAVDCRGQFLGSAAGRFLLLILAIVLTGIGAAMSLNMRVIPNPGDGIVQALADFFGKSVGFTKNCFDLWNISLTIVVSLVFAGHLIGIGLGTVAAVIGVGRVIAVFNHFCMKRMLELAGV